MPGILQRGQVPTDPRRRRHDADPGPGSRVRRCPARERPGRQAL